MFLPVRIRIGDGAVPPEGGQSGYDLDLGLRLHINAVVTTTGV
jgi:hypothetical protein